MRVTVMGSPSAAYWATKALRPAVMSLNSEPEMLAETSTTRVTFCGSPTTSLTLAVLSTASGTSSTTFTWKSPGTSSPVLSVALNSAVTSNQFSSLGPDRWSRSEENTYELQSLMRISYAVSCLKQKKHICMEN